MNKRNKHTIGLILGLLCMLLLTLGLKSCDSTVKLPTMGLGVHGVNGGSANVDDNAKKVDDLINGISTPITLESAGAISAARAAYDALSDADKAKVTSLDKLKGFEADLANLSGDIKEGTAAWLDNLLAQIKTPVTADQYDLLSQIRNGYNALPEDEKAKWTGLDKLNGFELDLFSKGANLDGLLNLINPPVTVDNAPLLARIRAAYDRLSDAEKVNFTGLDKLNGFELDLFGNAANLDSILDNIKTPITADDLDLINRIRAAYENLDETEKANFKGLDKLTGFELDLANMGLGGNGAGDVSSLVDLIKGINTPITLDSEADLNKALNLYNSLSDADKAKVTNYDLLQDYLKQLDELKNAGTDTGVDVPSTGVE